MTDKFHRRFSKSFSFFFCLECLSNTVGELLIAGNVVGDDSTLDDKLDDEFLLRHLLSTSNVISCCCSISFVCCFLDDDEFKKNRSL